MKKEPETLAEQLSDESTEALRELFKIATEIGLYGEALSVLGLPVGETLLKHSKSIRHYASQGSHSFCGYLAATERGALFGPPIKRNRL